MYFAVLGRHPKLSLAEFALIPTTSLRRQGSFLFFETDLAQDALLDFLSALGGIVKWGQVINNGQLTIDDEQGTNNKEIGDFLQGVSLIGVNDQKLGMELKKNYGIKRFKLVEVTSSDLEVKKEGKEIIDLGSDQIGLVFGWQDIRHFEVIDFEKPANGMEIGMMPAKLAQMMVNIGRTKLSIDDGQVTIDKKLTIYDPFCGFGTTGLVANRLGHHFVGSDIVIDGAKKNAKRRKEHGQLTIDGGPLFTVFKHDVMTTFDHPVVKKVDCIVTEGWLGPVVSKKTRESELTAHAKRIQELYISFLTNIHATCPDIPLVITIPHYARLPELIAPNILAHAAALGYQIDDLAVYSRKGQEVCRQVVVFF